MSYSGDTHTVRSTDHNQVLGYALLLDNEVVDDPEDCYLLPVKDTKYGKARPEDVTKNLVSDSDATSTLSSLGRALFGNCPVWSLV